jgi:hypothetical protein
MMTLNLLMSGLSAAAQQGGKANGRGYRVALIPFEVTGGRGSVPELVDPTLRECFQNNGYEIVAGQAVLDAAKELGVRAQGLPSDKDLLEIGKRVGADYVVAGNMTITSKKVWTPLPRAKAEAVVDTVIIEVSTGTVVYDPKKMIGVSQKDNRDQVGIGLLVSLPIALFMGGSKTKEETKAVKKTIEICYADFFRNTREGRKVAGK